MHMKSNTTNIIEDKIYIVQKNLNNHRSILILIDREIEIILEKGTLLTIYKYSYDNTRSDIETEFHTQTYNKVHISKKPS